MRLPPATRLIAGFQHKEDADRFLADLVERFARFGLGLKADKTRLIEFGRSAARDRKAKGLGKPETFDFLGFTHICGKTRAGEFRVQRKTVSKRRRSRLSELNDELKRRRHLPIPEQGRWVRSVAQGHLNYYAVPGNLKAVSSFIYELRRRWMRALQRRSQKTRITWTRYSRLACRLAAQSPQHAPVPRPPLCRHSPKVGAQCGSSARWDLCGGRGAISVPTAIGRHSETTRQLCTGRKTSTCSPSLRRVDGGARIRSLSPESSSTSKSLASPK